MKQIIIRIETEGDTTKTLVQKIGFEKGVSSNYEVIGMLQNLIDLELKKISMTKNFKITNKDNPDEKNGC
jgi:hypothetical protein